MVDQVNFQEKIQGESIRKTLAAKYDITKSAFKNMIEELLDEGKLKEQEIYTGGKPKTILQVP